MYGILSHLSKYESSPDPLCIPPQPVLGYDRKVLLETGNGYRIFKILFPFYIAGTGNLRLLSGSGLSGTGFFIPFSVSGRNRIKELTGIPAGILKDLYAL